MPGSKYNKLAGKDVLVIGGTSGIGFAVAEASLDSGANVILSSSTTATLTTAVERLQKSYPESKVRGYICDLSKPTLEQDIVGLFKEVGRIDHIVFTAGNRHAIVPLENTTYESIIRAAHVRFIAPFLVAKVGSKYLSPGPNSSIIFTTGAAADQPIPGWPAVAAVASALHGLTINLALDLKPIRVNVVSLNAVKTEAWDDLPEVARGDAFDLLVRNLPTGKIGMPEDVAECYLWLMKDSNVTGTIARSDGGTLLVGL